MWRKYWPQLLAAGLLALYWWMAVSVSPTRGVGADEIAHLTAGYSYWSLDDYRMQPENGNLPQRLAALPVYWSDARFPDSRQPVWEKSDVWSVGFQFFYMLGNDLGRMLWQGRAMIALLGVALGALVFAWSGRLFGVSGALVSVVLFAFCPNLLANGGLITSDMAASLGFLAATGAAWLLLHRVNVVNVLLLGLAAGGLSLAKFSAGLLVPIVLLMLLVRLLRPQPLPVGWFGPGAPVSGRGRISAALLGGVGAAALLAVLGIWAAFGFRYAMYNPRVATNAQPLHSWAEVTSWSSPAITAVGFARRHELLPEGYLYGFAQVYRFSRYRRAFLNGDYRLTGWASFFPYTTAVKTPLPALALGALTLGAFAWRRRRHPAPGPGLGEKFYPLTPLLTLGAVYGLFALSSPLNIGHRHVLPLYPVFYILAGAAGPLLWQASRIGAGVVVVLLGWFAWDSVAIRPHYLAYFNPLDGGPAEAYRHVVDSSLDWGQELPALKQWLDSNRRPGEPLFLSYFGSDDPVFRGIDAVRVGDSNFDLRERKVPAILGGGLYAISATQFQQVYTFAYGRWDEAKEQRYQELLGAAAENRVPAGFANRREFLNHLEDHQFARLCHSLQGRRPDALIGYAILVFRLSDAEVQRALYAPPGRPPESR
jgi:hypothetical protein